MRNTIYFVDPDLFLPVLAIWEMLIGLGLILALSICTGVGLDALAEMGGTLMTLWMGQDGVDYAFQGDYGRMWDDPIAALQAVADHSPALLAYTRDGDTVTVTVSATDNFVGTA